MRIIKITVMLLVAVVVVVVAVAIAVKTVRLFQDKPESSVVVR